LIIEPIKMDQIKDVLTFRLLPNRLLETLEANLAAHEEESVDYYFAGRITEFQKINYLLIDNLMKVRAQPSSETIDKSQQSDETKQAHQEAPATKPVTVREPTADDISAQLMKYKPLKPVDMPVAQPQPVTLPANELKMVPLEVSVNHKSPPRREDSVLINRMGRLVHGDKWWLFVFENRGITPQDAPIRILPNQLLENALDLSKDRLESTVFIISGEITAYRGDNYLLLRKVLVRRDMGNLR
jgi:hypothetical protein